MLRGVYDAKNVVRTYEHGRLHFVRYASAGDPRGELTSLTVPVTYLGASLSCKFMRSTRQDSRFEHEHSR